MSGGVRLTGNWRTIQVLLSGDPKRIRHRVRNILLAKLLRQLGVMDAWMRIWR